jgi:hypothetical protein
MLVVSLVWMFESLSIVLAEETKVIEYSVAAKE